MVLFWFWSSPESTHFLLSGISVFVESTMVRYSILKHNRSASMRTAKGVEGSHGYLNWMEFMSHYRLTKESTICAHREKESHWRVLIRAYGLSWGFLCKLSWSPESSTLPQLPSTGLIPRCSKAGSGRLVVPGFEFALKAIYLSTASVPMAPHIVW